MILSIYNFVSKYLLIIVFLFMMMSVSQAQIMITSGEDVTPMDLVENIVGEGVQYYNVQYQGAEEAKGMFTNGYSTNIGIDAGIILTSGYASIMQGPNFNTGATGSNGMPGDATLTGLSGQSTYDASILQFDFVPESDTLKFRYVFGSEEYPEYVIALYNDIFGYFVTGPNPDGGEYNDKNVAIVPGSDPELPVAIATINNVIPSYEEYYVDNTGGLTIEYDGFTVVLTAFIKVVACEEYHIKMAIADSGDGILDSGVVLEENSFESPKIDVQLEPYPEGVADNMIEGCVEADIIFQLPNSSYAPITVCFEITEGPGYAVNGVDYEEINNCITFEEGQDSLAIHVIPIKDNIPEGPEIVEFILTNELGCEVRYDTVTFIITDYEDMVDTISPPTVICQGQEIDLWVNVANGIPPYTYSWEPEPSDNDTLTVSPDEPGEYQYIVTFTDLCLDTVSDSTTVTVFPVPDIDIGPDSALMCEGDTINLNAGGGYLAYVWQDGSIDSTYTVTQGGYYTVMVFGAGGCVAHDTLFVEEIIINVDIGNDTTICEGDSLVLYAPVGFETFEWQDGSSEATYVAKETGSYWIMVEQDGCTKKDSIYLFVDDPAIGVQLGNDTTICAGDFITLSPLSGVWDEYSYLWNTGDTIGAISITNPGTYLLEVTGPCGSSTDEIVVGNFDYPDPSLGDDIFLCNGEYEYITAATGFYSYSWNNQPPSSDNELLVSETNSYWVEVVDYNGCVGNDTIFVEVGNLVDLGPASQILCEGDSIVLNAGNGFDFYTWNGVPGDQTMAVYNGGIYKVEVGYGANTECNSEDQVTIDYFELPDASITSGDYLCAGDTMWLRAPVGNYTYYWNDVQEDNTVHIIETGGLYTLKMENICGTDSTEKNIESRDLPPVDLGEDVLLFPEESVTLDAGVYEEYVWNDDENLNDQFLTLTSADIDGADSVYVLVYDGYCYNKDGLIVEVFDVKVPAVITPNGDGENDLFMPFEDGWSGIHDHSISVFNRWGEKVWESSNFEDGWDAKHNGTLVGDGTYFWVLEVKYGPQNLSKTYKGTLSVLGTGK